jgi:hypothetical protein
MYHLQHIINFLSECAENAPNKREGKNLSNKLRDIVVAAFVVFWFQYDFYLKFQIQMKTNIGLSNL